MAFPRPELRRSAILWLTWICSTPFIGSDSTPIPHHGRTGGATSRLPVKPTSPSSSGQPAIVAFTLHIAHFTFYTSCRTLWNIQRKYYLLHILHFLIFHVWQSLHIIHFALHTILVFQIPHLILHTPHWICTSYCTLNDVHVTLHTLQCTLHIENFTLNASQCEMHYMYCTLQTSHCILYHIYFTLYIPYCTFHITYFTLHRIWHITYHIWHCLLDIAHFRWYTHTQWCGRHFTLHPSQYTLCGSHFTLDFILYYIHTITHFTLQTPHCKLRDIICIIANFTLYTSHIWCALQITHFTYHTLCDVHFTLQLVLHTAHFTHFTLHTAWFTLHHYCTLHFVHFICICHPEHLTLQASTYTLHHPDFRLHTSSCKLHLTHLTLHASSYALHPANFILHTSPCRLQLSHFTLQTSPFTLPPQASPCILQAVTTWLTFPHPPAHWCGHYGLQFCPQRELRYPCLVCAKGLVFCPQWYLAMNILVHSTN